MAIRNSLFRFGLLTLFAANVVYVVSVHIRAPGAGGHLSVGGDFPSPPAEGLDGAPVNWRDRWTLALFFRTATVGADETARYVGELERRFRDAGLVVVAFVAGESGDVRRFAAMNRLEYPLVADRGDWEKALGLAGHDRGVFLVRPEGEVEFASVDFRPHDLRLLVESNLLGEASLESDPASAPLSPGDLLPDGDVRRVGRDKALRLHEVEADFLVFFGPECPVCSLGEAAVAYTQFDRAQKKRGKRVAGLFSTRFSEDDISGEISGFPPGARLYVALASLPGLDDGYRREAALGAEIVALELDAELRVVGMEVLR